jgi:hypothetical protein
MEKNYLKPEIIEENQVERKMVYAQTVSPGYDPETGEDPCA